MLKEESLQSAFNQKQHQKTAIIEKVNFVHLESLRSLVSLRIFSVDLMCINKREVTVIVKKNLQLFHAQNISIKLFH